MTETTCPYCLADESATEIGPAHKYVIVVSTPGGRQAFMCDYCGATLCVGGMADETDETWEAFQARPRKGV